MGANGEKLFPSKALNATTMKNASTSSLTITMTVLERADWRMPEMSRAATANTRNRAGTLTSPPSPGGRLTESGRVIPNSESSSSFR